MKQKRRSEVCREAHYNRTRGFSVDARKEKKSHMPAALGGEIGRVEARRRGGGVGWGGGVDSEVLQTHGK